MLEECIWLLFTHCQKLGWTPVDWNEELVRTLHKGGRKGILNNYRDISLTNNIGKVFASLLNLRLQETAELRGWLPEAQASSRKGRGTMDHIFVLSALIEQARKQRTPYAWDSWM